MEEYRERSLGWKLLIAEISEDYLGAAVKQHGDTVIIIDEVVLTIVSTIRVEPRVNLELVPCNG